MSLTNRQRLSTTPMLRSRCGKALHLYVFCSFAISQPVLDRLGQNPPFLVNENISPQAIYVLLVAVCLVIPAALLLIEQTMTLVFPSLREAFWSILIFGLLYLIALPALKRARILEGPLLLGTALGCAALATWGYFSKRQIRAIVTTGVCGGVAFPLLFLFDSPVTKLLFPRVTTQLTAHARNPAPVVILVFDEFCGLSLLTPERTLDEQRFPNFARLAARASWFPHATSVHGQTAHALPAILSGRYPTGATIPIAAEREQNLFRLLDATGAYELAVFEPVSRLAPQRSDDAGLSSPDFGRQLQTLFRALVRVYLYHVTPVDYGLQLPSIPKAWFGAPDGQPIDSHQRRGVFRYQWGSRRDLQLEHFLDCLEETTQPTLYFQHVLLPHVPWCYLPSGRAYTTDDDWEWITFDPHLGQIDYWGTDELVVAQRQQRYLLQLGYLDRFIGRVLDRLEDCGLYDNCLLIVTADHGVAFRPNGPRRDISTDNAAEILSVPLFIKRPHQSTGEICLRPAESVDLLPTIAETLGLELREPIDGWSVFDRTLPERTEISHFDERLSRRTFDPAIVRKSDVPDQVAARFGPSHDPQALYRTGPVPELVGWPVARLPQTDGPVVELELLRTGSSGSERPSWLTPCYLEGFVRSPPDLQQPMTLAVAVDGTIGAVTRTYELPGLRDRWSALIPDSMLKNGDCQIDIYSVTWLPAGPHISRCVTRKPTIPPFRPNPRTKPR